MDTVRINFRLVGEEAAALRQWCAKDLRKPIDQIRWLLRRELQQMGYLPYPGQKETQAAAQEPEADHEN